MLKIYINTVPDSTISSEIEFANYLLSNTKNYQDFCKKVGKRKADKVSELYQKVFLREKAIFIPKAVNKLSLNERLFLKNPENILKYPSQFEKYGSLLKVQETNLTELDRTLSKYLKMEYTSPDYIYILNNEPRFSQYEDVVYGISSKRVSYKNRNILSCFHHILENFLKKNVKEPIHVSYRLGTQLS